MPRVPNVTSQKQEALSSPTSKCSRFGINSISGVVTCLRERTSTSKPRGDPGAEDVSRFGRDMAMAEARPKQALGPAYGDDSNGGSAVADSVGPVNGRFQRHRTGALDPLRPFARYVRVTSVQRELSLTSSNWPPRCGPSFFEFSGVCKPGGNHAAWPTRTDCAERSLSTVEA